MLQTCAQMQLTSKLHPRRSFYHCSPIQYWPIIDYIITLDRVYDYFISCVELLVNTTKHLHKQQALTKTQRLLICSKIFSTCFEILANLYWYIDNISYWHRVLFLNVLIILSNIKYILFIPHSLIWFQFC